MSYAVKIYNPRTSSYSWINIGQPVCPKGSLCIFIAITPNCAKTMHIKTCRQKYICNIFFITFASKRLQWSSNVYCPYSTQSINLSLIICIHHNTSLGKMLNLHAKCSRMHYRAPQIVPGIDITLSSTLRFPLYISTL